MAAANTDKLKKLARKWVGQVGAGGVSDETVTTVPLASATNLPTDTAVIATIDRVNSTGVATPALEESVIGVVSGTDLVSCVRGSEGTAQAHAAGAVVEILVTAKGYNDIIDAFLVGHGQDGTHASSITTLTGTQTLTNKTLTTPIVASFYQDAGKTKLMTTPDTASDTLTAIAATQTLTNKRITKRVVGTTSSATPTPNADTTDIYTLTALAEAAEFGAPSGTPTNGQTLVIRIKPDATPRALTWNAAYVAGGTALPSTTVASKILTIGFIYNTDNSLNKWMCVASAQEA